MAPVSLASAAAVKVAASASRLPVMRVVPVKLHLASRLGLLSLLLVTTMAGPLGYQHSFVTRAVADEPAKGSACVIEANGGQTTCMCLSTQRTVEPLEATLSTTKSSLQLVCQSSLKFIPQAPDNNKHVCPADVAVLKQCTGSGDGNTSIDVTTLLGGATQEIEWQNVEDVKGSTTKKLIIPPANLPYAEQSFIVGCVDAEGEPKCKLTVTLEARASVTEDQTVTCAYGKTSNPKHQSIKLSQSRNRFTLVCGKDGEVLPKEYRSKFCKFGKEQDASTADCTGNYTEILPVYETKWWDYDPRSTTYSLVIPEGGFPEEKTEIMVGCQKRESAESSAKVKEEASADSPTVCSVDVTIEGVLSSASFFPRGVVDTFSWVVGFGAMLTAFDVW
ncbi:SAG-related sequence SRS38A [Toxoplasma gondii MAS]|uniref:SAG-related sequence SRS38A n=2 Tax=Toxoplasma gondii TaxID=5811 RepID=A0A086QMD7_TOXGO|nr:SAG-related sequence SRS38A [Toxoplasma gondii MAS]PUA85497.1 SAG-related sequence SRS38A [Toxoplasma gondii TgCATBr9]